MVCFNPNLQDLEGCEATPIDQLFNSGRRRRGAPNTNSRYVSRSMDESKGEELMDQFIRDVTGTEKQVKHRSHQRPSVCLCGKEICVRTNSSHLDTEVIV